MSGYVFVAPQRIALRCPVTDLEECLTCKGLDHHRYEVWEFPKRRPKCPKHNVLLVPVR